MGRDVHLGPGDSITFNPRTGRYDWKTTLANGRELEGTADTENEAKQIIGDWQSTARPLRFRAPRGLFFRK